MAGVTLAQAQTALTDWINADASVATGQSYTIGSRSLTRANAQEITEKIKFWSRYCDKLTRGSGPKVRRVLPRDDV